MTLRLWITTFSSAGHLALALLAFSTARRTRLARSVGFASLAIACWLFSQVMLRRTDYIRWDHAAQIFSVLSVVAGTYVVLGFVGHTNSARGRALRVAVWATGAPLIATSLFEPHVPLFRRWPGSFSWAIAIGSFGLGWMTVSMSLLAWHRHVQSDRDERYRTSLLFTALLINTISAMIELTKALGLPRPNLGHLGTLAGTLLTAAVVFQSVPNGGKRPSVLEAATAIAIGATAVSVIHAIFAIAGHNPAILALSVASCTVLAFGALRSTLTMRAERHARDERHLLLGRMVEQLLHDLKNPLAALRGATQVIERQIESRGSIDASNTMVPLLRPQVERIEEVLDRYMRMAKITPSLHEDSVGPLVEEVVAGLDAATLGAVKVVCEVAAGLAPAKLDRALLQSALDNLLRNAIDAMPSGGTLTVSVETARDRDMPRAVVITIEDTGQGMDPRVLAQAGEVFFTTKATGTGLGLSFARRVVAEHGGKLTLESRLGSGTTVRVLLPTE